MVTKNGNVLLMVPDGTGIKNYLYSKVFQDSDRPIILFHNFDADTLRQIKQHLTIERDVVIPSYHESLKERWYRELIHVARIKYNARITKNPTLLKFWKKKKGGLKKNLFYRSVARASRGIRSYQKIQSLEKKYQAALRKNTFYTQVTQLLKEEDITSVFCTHQRALKAPTVFAAAKDISIKTTAVIYSWDNIPKARLALRADQYLVWSKHMKKELLYFYPELPAESIHVTGTPQFEFYYDPNNLVSKEDFAATYQLDLQKQWICFSGDDVGTSPHDPQYLADIAAALTEAGMDREVQLLFRRCPVDVSGRYDAVVAKYPDLIIDMPPLWNFNKKVWTAVYPTYEDVCLLVSLAKHADAVINVGSTMAFDFGMFQKPCIYINYDAVEDPAWSTETIYQYQHFRSMPSPDAVYWMNDKEHIATIIKKALAQPQTSIDSWFEVVVNHPKEASQNIKKLL
ncbi:hypothetical protein [Altibacter sp. HG106]|uniref:hypothetical protein n=1 Tax=Altibacter sp. HG106 TaxID=3023937 RepID=UPI002350F8AA|nr:hypothetical protein [Altibacter sp. HG106]MDC7995695.1 hypothetical protein [Altibacter sp. HG106]